MKQTDKVTNNGTYRTRGLSMQNTTTILIFKTVNNELRTVKNPSAELVNHAEKWCIDSILKIYDFETCEIITLYNDSFSWTELAYEINSGLKNFKAQSIEKTAV